MPLCPFRRLFPVIHPHQRMGQAHFGIPGVNPPLLQSGSQTFQLLRGDIRRQPVKLQHQLIGNGHGFAEYFPGLFINADVVAQAFAHFVDAVQPLQKRHGHDYLGRHSVLLLQRSAHQQIEGLVRSAQLHIRLQRNGVIPLHQRVKELMDMDGLAAGVALLEIIPLQHPGYCGFGRQPYHIGKGQRSQPL
ncbi:hypothetical protein D3C75_830100 [compost metagenome]